jgi:hypothetical protein
MSSEMEGMRKETVMAQFNVLSRNHLGILSKTKIVGFPPRSPIGHPLDSREKARCWKEPICY